jgi:hypothetical protein
MNRAQLSGLAMAALIRQPEFSLGFAIPANATDADRKRVIEERPKLIAEAAVKFADALLVELSKQLE